MAMERGAAQDGLEAPEWRQLRGGAPGNEARSVPVASELDGEGPEEEPGQAFEEGEREPGEVGPAGHEQQAGGAGADDRPNPRVRGAVEALSRKSIQAQCARSSRVAEDRAAPLGRWPSGPPTFRGRTSQAAVGDGA